jgi:hypothetical protein
MVGNMIVLGLLQIATIYSETFQQFLAVRALFVSFFNALSSLQNSLTTNDISRVSLWEVSMVTRSAWLSSIARESRPISFFSSQLQELTIAVFQQ